MPSLQAPILATDSLSKNFGQVVANDAVSLNIHRGQIHALLGENGAGKSTLVKMLYGLLQPDSGTIAYNGTPLTITSPKHAKTLGIAMVFQHFSLFPALSVLENIALALDASHANLREQAQAESARHTLNIDLDCPAGQLSVGAKQRVEILRCLLQNPSVLIMDEPTSVLTPAESESLFAVLKKLAKEGCAILYISHKLAEITEIADTATVLRGGRKIGTVNPKKTTANALAKMMVGAITPPLKRDTSAKGKNSTNQKRPKPLLQITALNRPAAHDFATALKDITFAVRAGEILGIAGVAGNGQQELTDSLSGEWRTPKTNTPKTNTPQGNTIVFAGTDISQFSPHQRRQLGIETLPEERLGHASIPALPLTHNAFLTRFQQYQKGKPRGLKTLISPNDASADTAQIITEGDVRIGGKNPLAQHLSGGNLQKFILGRLLLAQPKLAVICQPTWGVDIGAATAIRRRLIALAEGGCAIILISQDSEEILALATHIAVLYRGRLSPPQPAHTMTASAVGLLMGGEAMMGENRC